MAKAKKATPKSVDALPAGAVMRVGSERFHHPTGFVESAWSHDAKHLAIGGQSSLLTLWTREGEPVCSVRFPKTRHGDGCVRDIRFTRDGAMVASCNGVIIVTDTTSGKEIVRVAAKGPFGPPFQISADGRFILLWDRGIAFHDIDTGALVRTLAGVGSIFAVSADGTRFACAQEGLCVVDADTGARVTQSVPLEYDPGQSRVVRFVRGDTCVLLLERSLKTMRARIMDARSGEVLFDRMLASDSLPVGVPRPHSILSDGRLLVSDDADHLRVFDAESGALSEPLLHVGRVVRATASHDDALLAVVAPGPSLRVIPLFASMTDVPVRHARWLHGFRGERVVWSGDDEALTFTHVADGTEVSQRIEGGEVIEVSPSSALLVAREIGTPRTHRDSGYAYWFRAVKRVGDGFVDLKSGGKFHSTCRITSDDRWGVSADGTKNVFIKDLATGAIVRTLVGHRAEPVYAVAFSPDGSRIGSGANDGDARIWDFETGACLHRLSGHRGYVWCLRFSADGALVATGGSDKTVRIWNVASGANLFCFEGHGAFVRAVVFAPDLTWLASGDEKRVRLWDLPTGASLVEIKTPGVALDVSQDGRRLVSGSGRSAIVWSVDALLGVSAQ